ncbi:MAG: hypothetical protein EB116_12255 [Betaproteobacteria bacterium]|nr:hypothetical protein [Betaproteobacteria bacterium]
MKVMLPILVAIFSLNLYAQPLMLVSEAEAKASIEAGGLPTPRSTPQPGAPRIELLSPDIKKPVNVPTKIEVKFSGNPPAEPKPETFKALYGAFKIDITQRLLGVAKVTKDGIQVTDASLPSGKHQLLLSLTDTLGRESQQVISFIVP